MISKAKKQKLPEQAITISQVEIKIPHGMCVYMYVCVRACVCTPRDRAGCQSDFKLFIA